MFKRVDCFRICEACRQLDNEEAIKCEHIPQTAHWLSESRTKRLKGLYSNASALALREYGGMIVSDHAPVYAKRDIAAAFALPRVQTTAPPNIIFTAVDPSGGGPSHMAITSGYYTNNGDFVVSFNRLLLGLYIIQYSCIITCKNPSTIPMMVNCE